MKESKQHVMDRFSSQYPYIPKYSTIQTPIPYQNINIERSLNNPH